jgi:hypothetical protein
MRGDLSDTPAADVCRALASAGATGVLELEGPAGRGTIAYEGGHVVAAASPTPQARVGDRLVHRGHLDPEVLARTLEEQARTGRAHGVGAMLVERGIVDDAAVRDVVQEQVLDAVFELLDWRYGAYRFEPGVFGAADEVPEVPLRLRVDQLLAEVARRHREWDEVERVLPDLEAVPRFPAGGGTSTSTAFEADELALLASIDGVRSVRALADDLGFGRFEAARIVFGLNRRDVLEIALPEDEIGRALEEAIRGLSSGRDDTGDPSPPRSAVPEPAPEPEELAAPEPERSPEPIAEPDAPAEPEEPAEQAEPVAGPDTPPAPHEPPALSDVSRLLAELEMDIGGPRGTVDGAAARDVDQDPEAEHDLPAAPGPEVTSEPRAGAPGDPVTVEEPAAPEPEPARPSGEDVSELLRELSRMAHEGPDEEERPDPPPGGGPGPSSSGGPGPTSPGGPGASGSDASPRRKRRFGRG